MTGTAWFDDVEVVRLVDPPMQTYCLHRVPRNGFPRTDRDGTRASELNLADYDIKPEDLRLTASLRRTAADNILWESNELRTQQPTDSIRRYGAFARIGGGPI